MVPRASHVRSVLSATIAVAALFAIGLILGAVDVAFILAPEPVLAQCPWEDWLGDTDWEPTNHITNTVAGEIRLAGEDPDWHGRRPYIHLSKWFYFPSNCSEWPSGSQWPGKFYLYDVIEFDVAEDSDLCDTSTWWRFTTFPGLTGGEGMATFSDVLLLYEDCFDPLSPCRNVLAAHDFSPAYGGDESLLLMPLEAGHHKLVITTSGYSTEESPVEGDYRLVINAPLGENPNPTTPAEEPDCPAESVVCLGLLNCSDATLTRPYGNGLCRSPSGWQWAYEQYQFTVTTHGWWEFSLCEDTNHIDPFLALYRDSIDCANLEAVNDDFWVS